MVPFEFQAVVMAAGKGSRMTEITSGRPKCLLPIANMPMVWYPLRMLEREGFQDAILMVAESAKTDVQTALEHCNLSIHLDIIALPPGSEEWGTADSLRFISDKIKSDIVVVSCDLILDASLYPVFDLFRKNEAAVTMLFLKPQEGSSGEALPTPGPKSKHKPERDLVGIDPNTARLVSLASVSDFEETLPVSRSTLQKHPHLQLHSRLLDSHLYIIRHWICQFLSQDKTFSTLKGELLPYIVRKQSGKAPKVVEGESNGANVTATKDVHQFSEESTFLSKVLSMTSYNDHWGDMQPMFQGDRIRCYAHIADNFGVRVNTLQAYSSINREVVPRWKSVTGEEQINYKHPSADIKSTQVDELSLVGENTKLSEKTSFRNTTLGANCQVQSRTRIANSIIMNNVKISEGCVVSNCIVCDDVDIGPNTELKDCLIGNRFSVPTGEKHSQEVLADEDLLMEI